MVICPSNAATLFHAYRRQMRRDYRKPLINLVSKKLLKLREASSPFADFDHDRFSAILGESNPEVKPEGVKKVIICCGQAYHSANEQRKELKRNVIFCVYSGCSNYSSRTACAILLRRSKKRSQKVSSS